MVTLEASNASNEISKQYRFSRDRDNASADSEFGEEPEYEAVREYEWEFAEHLAFPTMVIFTAAVIPLTLDVDKWYAREGWAAIGLALIVAVTGFYFATARRRSPAIAGS